MNDLTVNNSNEILMSSVEFYKFLKQDNPKLEYRKMLKVLKDELEIGDGKFFHHKLHTTSVLACELDEYDLIQLGSRLSKPIRIKTIELIKSLKAELDNKPKVPQTYAEALSEALRLEQERLVLENKVKQDAPKVNAYDKKMSRSNLQNATTVAKVYGITATKLNKILDIIGFYNKTIKRGRIPNQWVIDRKYAKVVETTEGYNQTLFTQKGIEFIDGIMLNKP